MESEPVVWELEEIKRSEGFLGRRQVHIVTIRAGDERWVVERVADTWAGTEQVRVYAPPGTVYRPRTAKVKDPWKLAEDIILFMARQAGGAGGGLEAAAQALGDPANPGRGELLKRLLESGKARIRR
jgi:hypothetical protein